MRLLVILAMIIFTFSTKVIAYPQTQLKDCVLSAKQNPVILGVPEKSIEDFCDCALKLIVDEGKEGKPSANKCASEAFG